MNNRKGRAGGLCDGGDCVVERVVLCCCMVECVGVGGLMVLLVGVVCGSVLCLSSCIDGCCVVWCGVLSVFAGAVWSELHTCIQCSTSANSKHHKHRTAVFV
jgi:hypothetical protein